MATTAVIFDFFGTLTPSTPTDVWDDHAARSAAPTAHVGDLGEDVSFSRPERLRPTALGLFRHEQVAVVRE
jgi:hypothetical protein